MTTSSVQFLSPRRVQLVGLPQPSTNGRPVESSPAFALAGPALTPRKVRRNLFGSPKPGEITELLHNETARRRSYMLQRYNFDILSPQTIEGGSAECTPDATANRSKHLANRISKELAEYSKAVGEASPSSKPTIEENGLDQVRAIGSCEYTKLKSFKQNTKRFSSMTVASRSKSSERLKPYERQPLITDCYIQRKRSSGATGTNNRSTVPAVNDLQQNSAETVAPAGVSIASKAPVTNIVKYANLQ